jgi:hypothetical protein
VEGGGLPDTGAITGAGKITGGGLPYGMIGNTGAFFSRSVYSNTRNYR